MKRNLWMVSFVFLLTACQPSTLTPITTSSSFSMPTLEVSTATPSPATASLPTASATVPASVIELEGVAMPPGFSIIKFAEVYRPTAFAFDTHGSMYVTSVDNHVYLLSDTNADGRADSKTTFAAGYYLPLGVTVHLATGDVYISHQGAITVLQDTDGDRVADTSRLFASNLPTDLHQNDNLKFGPDGWLYMGLGSTCDACVESDPRNATILRFNIENGASEVYARGLRNPYDIAFDPITGDLFATDNGRDDLGLDAPSEELNHIIQNGDYGYPACWDSHDQPGCETAIPPVALFEPHSSANSLDFYAGNEFPSEYRGNAFVSIFGSWLKPGVQTGIQRVVLAKEGESYTASASWFVRFPAGVMPLPLLFGLDGALYVGDYINNIIYRVSYGLP